MGFSERIVIVTGGASGIGRAVSLAFGARGARVAVADLDPAGAGAVSSEVADAGGEALAVRVDVTDAGSVRTAFDGVADTWGRIDVLVNVAGWDKILPFAETDEGFWDKVIAVNFRGTLATCHAALPHLIAAGGGAIVNTASEAGRSGSSGEAVYSGTKGAVIAFTKALAREVARNGIRVNAVAPGLTDTPLLQGMIAEGNEKLVDAIVKATPLRRLARPEEVAEAIVFLASDRASFITGQTLGVGGGLVMA